MKRLNNKGTTLVELIVGVVLLAIASMMLLTCFTSAANIINKAQKFQHANEMTKACVELQKDIETDETAAEYDEDLVVTKDSSIDVSLNEFNSKDTLVNLTFDYNVTKNDKQTGKKGTVTVTGSYIVGTESSTGLRYREYLSSEFNFID